MGIISPSNPTAGTPVTAASVANPINTIKNEFNGNIDNNNIKANANIAWSKIAKSGSAISDIADTDISSPGTGHIIYRDAAGKWKNLAPGSSEQVLRINSGIPAWETIVTIPVGTIVMWSGTIANIPSGWAICDGNNGTPNLIDKFIIGVATAATNPADAGGSHTLTSGNASSAAQAVQESPSPPTNGIPNQSHTHNVVMTGVKHFRLAFIMKT